MVLAEAAYSVLKSITPPGVDPIMFLLTYVLSVAMVWPLTGLIHFMKDNRAVRVFTTFVLAYFIAASGLVTLVISKFFPAVGMSIMIVFGILLVIALVFPDIVKEGKFKGVGAGLLLLFAFIIVIWVSWYGLASELGLQAGVPLPGLTPLDWFIVIIIILIVLGIIWSLGGKKEGGGVLFKAVPEK